MLIIQRLFYFAIGSLPTLLILLAHAAGAIAALILTIRHKSTPAVLALIGFGVLLVLNLVGLGIGLISTLLPAILLERDPFMYFEVMYGIGIANLGLNCCCSLITAAAIACLIAALWQAVSSGRTEEAPELP